MAMQSQDDTLTFDAYNSISNIRPDLLRALIDHAEHGITIAEREGDDTILLYVNRAFEQLSGYTAEECLYKDCRFLQGDDRNQEGRDLILKSIEDKAATTVVLRNYRKDGSLFWNEVTITPYFDEHDGITYYIGVQKDITTQVTLREQLAIAQARIAELEDKFVDLASK